MISCHTHDYVEIACMYQIKVKIDLKSGKSVIGRAITTKYNINKNECMIIQTNTGRVDLVLTEIVTLSACEPNPHFDTVSFP